MVELVRARAFRVSRSFDDALGALDRAEGHLTVSQRLPLVARVHRERAACWADADRAEEAVSMLRQARDEFAYFDCALDVAAIDRQIDLFRWPHH